MHKKIYLRADGGTEIGMGHIMRTSVLAEALKEFAEIIYICRKGDEFSTGRDFAREKGYYVFEINDNDDLFRMKNVFDSCIITDSYNINEDYFDNIKKVFSFSGYIDDLNCFKFNLDFLINQNPYALDILYRANSEIKLFLGLKYAMLRNEFKNLPKRFIKKEINNILITLGGSDANNNSKEIILQLCNSFPNTMIHVAIGKSFIYYNDLIEMKRTNVKFYKNAKMVDLMLLCDVAISACGSTLYELAACGTPTIGIVVADNQKMAAKKMDSIKAIKYSEINKISCEINKLDYNKREKMAEVGQSLVDGTGSQRLASEILKII